jgi:hypothetical protein
VIAVWRRVLAALLLLAGTSCAVGQTTAATATEQTAPASELVTEAESLLFETDHMAGLALPARLDYRFSWDGDKPFEDRVILTVSRTRLAEVDYLSGAYHVNYPPVEHASGNPLLLYFLEHDLREMRRQTAGQPDYFRRLIRRAMARPDLKAEPTEVTVAGRKVAAMRVVIEPFRADPKAPERYPALIGKTYEFILAPTVPGQIVRLTSHVPLAGGKMDTVQVELTGSGSI